MATSSAGVAKVSVVYAAAAVADADDLSVTALSAASLVSSWSAGQRSFEKFCSAAASAVATL